ncbi:helix-turn-helix domain-containing protein [Dysgonomonas sp. ZJ709]|uniref:winged helix-turn-helix transcriptional regulator n=1 Tax=Dysgonomonas sp. ZJ709 TaxID=2709797 RepID=UPI0013EC6B5E|nr:helix-turn-helix domain-containing protein [Dysgonomonas sp. ZJ709]
MENISKYQFCPIRDVLSHLSDKWSLLVVIVLSRNGTMRFNEIQKDIEDISQRMLTVTLRSLEADGLINRKIYAEVPPRVEYELTPLGATLLNPLRGLVEWAQENTITIHENRKKYTENKSL